jgi:quercetin dioxygenase-like cupin family protein
VPARRCQTRESRAEFGGTGVRLNTRECSNNEETIMRRILLAAAVGAAIGAGGLALAQHGYRGPETVRTLSERDIVETLDGQKARVTTQEVTFEPGQAGLPHRHAGPIFGYVLEGEFEFAIDDQPAKVLKAGETFYEPTGCLHRVAKNPAAKGKTRVLAVILHPRDAKQVTIPEPKKK